MLIKMNR